MRTSLPLMLLGFLFSFSAFAQLAVDANTLALWNFNNDQDTVVLDSSPSAIHGSANAVSLLNSPFGLGKARYFRDQTSFISFPIPQLNSALDLSSKSLWTIEMTILLTQVTTSTRNLYSGGGVVIEIQDGRLSAVVNSDGVSYGVKTDLQLQRNITYRITVSSTPTELGILVNNRVWASQSKEPNKKIKEDKGIQQSILIGGSQRDSIETASMGLQHGCALSDVGQVYCWGDNSDGQMGQGSFGFGSNIPLPVVNNAIAGKISSGSRFSCSANADKIFCWGSNDQLSLGVPGFQKAHTPVQVMNGVNVLSLKSADRHSCALMVGGTITCWGRNTEGQIGIGIFTDSQLPMNVPNLANVKKIAVGGNHTCAIDSGDRVLCWGSNSSGELGLGHNNNSSAPQTVQSLPGLAVDISAGANHTCALLDTNEIYCWGANDRGQLGIGQTSAGSSSPVLVTGIVPDVPRGIFSGIGSYTCAKLDTNRAKCWGDNSKTQLGIPANISFSTTAIDAGLTEVGNLYPGYQTTCFSKNRNLSCLGANDFGLLARGSFNPVATQSDSAALVFKQTFLPGFIDEVRVSKTLRLPITRPTFTAQFDPHVTTPNPTLQFQIASVVSLNNSSLSVRLNGYAVTGLNFSGLTLSGTLSNQLHPGSNRLAISVQDTFGNVGQILLELIYDPSTTGQGILQIATGVNNSCIVDDVGDVYCWGSNQWGQLGLETQVFSSSPVKNPFLNNIVKVVLSNGTLCALDGEGVVSCLGSNEFGQLGDESYFLQSRSIPASINFIHPVSDIFSGPNAFCVQSPEVQGLYCWGSNFNDNLGTIPGVNFFPVHAEGTDDAYSVSIASDHSCYIIGSDRSVYCRGLNNYGQLGDGTTTYSKDLVRSGLISGVTSLATATGVSCARNSFSQVYCWGQNHGGQFGRGDHPIIIHNPKPVPLPFPPPLPSPGPTPTPPPAPDQDDFYPEGSKTPAFSFYAQDASDIMLGDGYACSHVTDNRLKCWGTGSLGQLGSGNYESYYQGFTHSELYQQVSVTQSTVCVLNSQNAPYCWGSNFIGQAGTPFIGTIPSPTQVTTHTVVPPVLSKLASGEGNTCMKEGSTPMCWGSSKQGQLGIGNEILEPQLYPLMNPHNMDVIQTAIGYAHICHLTSAHAVVCSGQNEMWQTGYESDATLRVYGYTPVHNLPRSIQVEAGENFTCALSEVGEVWCWGNNLNGQLGEETVDYRSGTPVKVRGLSGVTQIDIGVRGFHACARKDDGTVWCWGSNAAKQISETGSGRYPFPAEVPALKNSIEIALGNNTTCGLSATGVVACSWYNFYGQAGIGNLSSNVGYHPVKSNVFFKAIRAGSNHMCGIGTDDDLYCWGRNSNGQIGNGTISKSFNLPQRVFQDVREVALGGDHTCVISKNNRLACWGYNGLGQFGNGTMADSSTPVFSDISKKR